MRYRAKTLCVQIKAPASPVKRGRRPRSGTTLVPLKKAGVDPVTAMTFSSVQEAIGFARAAKAAAIPVVVCCIVARGGRRIGLWTIEEAITRVNAATGAAPACYMIICTHPTEFEPGLTPGDWTLRQGGIHAERRSDGDAGFVQTRSS